MSSLEEERREVGRMLISKQSLWSRQRCCYYYHHRPPSPDFNQVLNTSIVAPGRGSSRLLFFLPLSNRIEPRHGYCTNALGLARLCSPPIGWIRSVLQRRKRFWARTRGDRCATGIVKGLWIRGGDRLLEGEEGRTVMNSSVLYFSFFFFFDVHREEIYQNYRRSKKIALGIL